MQHWQSTDQTGSLDNRPKIETSVWSSYPYTGQPGPYDDVASSWVPAIPDQLNYGELSADNQEPDEHFYSPPESIFHGDSHPNIDLSFGQSDHQKALDLVFDGLDSQIYGPEGLDFGAQMSSAPAVAQHTRLDDQSFSRDLFSFGHDTNSALDASLLSYPEPDLMLQSITNTPVAQTPAVNQSGPNTVAHYSTHKVAGPLGGSQVLSSTEYHSPPNPYHGGGFSTSPSVPLPTPTQPGSFTPKQNHLNPTNNSAPATALHHGSHQLAYPKSTRTAPSPSTLGPVASDLNILDIRKPQVLAAKKPPLSLPTNTGWKNSYPVPSIGTRNPASDSPDPIPRPCSTKVEVEIMTKYAARDVSDMAKLPLIKGLPFLASSGTIRLPVPKIYDRLPHLVAIPSSSGKAMVPEFGYDIPCEVQGRFSQRYRPSPGTQAGLDGRRREAAALLSEYDQDMKKLGRRRPKFTEYPLSFKEQIKFDETLRSKAEKRARRELAEEQMKPIRAETRPSDAVEAAVWDMLGIIFLDRSSARTTARIAGAVQQAGDLFIKLRGEMNRTKQVLDNATKEKEVAGTMGNATQAYETRRDAFYKSLKAAIAYGDEAVVENLGGHQKLVLTLVNTLISCIKMGDFSGEMPKAVLELMSRFSMSKKIAENAHFDNVRKRLMDKGDDDVKKLLKRISFQIQKPAAQPETEVVASPAAAAPPIARDLPKLSVDMSPAKRGRDEDGEVRLVKRVAMEPGTSLSKKLGGASKTSLSSSLIAKYTASATKPSTTSAVLPGQIRPTAKARGDGAQMERGSLSYASPTLNSASDVKPALVAKQSAPKAFTTKLDGAKVAAVKASLNSNPVTGIASLLDSINAPKPEAASTKDSAFPSDASEDPTARAVRLRKEARRKLRVSWKPDEELVQIKLFYKQAAEDDGGARRMTKDAADDKSEGLVLKRRAHVVDEDEDEDDIPYQPWVQPTTIDFSDLPETVRAKVYVNRGGMLEFQTAEQVFIRNREQRELMVSYTDPDDMPNSPKSPPSETLNSNAEGKLYRLPVEKFDEIHRRWNEVQKFGADGAAYYAFQRLDSLGPSLRVNSFVGPAKPIVVEGSQGHSTVGTSTPGAEQVLQMLASTKVKMWQETPIPQPAATGDSTSPAVLSAISIICSLVEPLIHQPYPPSGPPSWLKSEEKIKEWLSGHKVEAATKTMASAEILEPITPFSGVTVDSHAEQRAQDWARYYQQQAYGNYMALVQQMQATGASIHPGHLQPDANQFPVMPGQLSQLSSAHASAQSQTQVDQAYRQLLSLQQLQQSSTNTGLR